MSLTILCLFLVMLNGVNARLKPRRTDLTDFGIQYLFHGWVDVQGQGANNDYCRFVGPLLKSKYVWLSCALAGTQGESEYNYNPPAGGKEPMDIGYNSTWYMRDHNGDGRADYCRCTDVKKHTRITCMLAGRFGFQCNSHGFNVAGSDGCYLL